MAEQGYELGWDDQIQNDSPGFVVLPEGDYDFEVVEFERARHAGSAKLPPCNKAVVHIKVEGPEGVSIIKHNLYQYSSTEGMICDFFVAIGLRQRKQSYRPEWNKIVGCKGRAKVGIRKYKSDNGDDREINEIKRFYEPTETQKPTYKAGTF